MGIEVTWRWLVNPTPDLTDDAWRMLAEKDREDLTRADALVLFAEADREGGGGRHVEFGMALALGAHHQSPLRLERDPPFRYPDRIVGRLGNRRIYDEVSIPTELRRNYDVYDCIRELGIEADEPLR